MAACRVDGHSTYDRAHDVPRRDPVGSRGTFRIVAGGRSPCPPQVPECFETVAFRSGCRVPCGVLWLLGCGGRDLAQDLWPAGVFNS